MPRPAVRTPTRVPAHVPPSTAWAVNAGLAWFGVLLTLVVSALGGYVETVPKGHVYGVNGTGVAGTFARLADSLSYFTTWSNVAVAASSTVLAVGRRPRGPRRRALHLSALLMISITALVNAVVLAPTAVVVGWSYVTNPLAHVLVPLLTLGVWLRYGPRGEITPRTVAGSLVLPLVWVAFMLVRGIVIGVYPYDFADVATLGYPTVARSLLVVLALALVIDVLLWGVDLALTRRTLSRCASRLVPEPRGQVPQNVTYGGASDGAGPARSARSGRSS